MTSSEEVRAHLQAVLVESSDVPLGMTLEEWRVSQYVPKRSLFYRVTHWKGEGNEDRNRLSD